MFECNACIDPVAKPRIRYAKPYCESCWQTAMAAARYRIAAERTAQRVAAGLASPEPPLNHVYPKRRAAR